MSKILAKYIGLWATSKITIYNTAWVIIGKIIVFALSFVWVTGLANLVSKETAGMYSYIQSIVAIISITTLPGMGTAVVRAVAGGNEGSVRTMMRFRLLAGIVGSCISFGIGLLYCMRGNNVLGWTFMVLAPLIPMTDTWNEIAYYFFQGRKNFKKATIIAIVYQALFTIPAFITLYISDSIVVIYSVFAVGQVIGGYVVYSFVHPKNTLRDTVAERFGFHLTVMSVVRIIANNIDRILVWQVLGPAAVAAYTFASIPLSKAEQLVPIEAIALPMLSRMDATDATKKAIIKKFWIVVCSMIPVVGIGITITPIVFQLLFPAFPESIPLFRALLITLLFTPFLLFKTSLTAWYKQRSLYLIETVSPLLRIGLIVTLGFWGGLWWMIIGIIISKIIESVIILVMFLKTKESQVVK